MEELIPQFAKAFNAQTEKRFLLNFIVSKEINESVLISKGFPHGLIKRTKWLIYPSKFSGPGTLRDHWIISTEKERHKYCIFLDVDDEQSPLFLEKLLRTAESTSADITCCGYTRISKSNGHVLAVEMVHNPQSINVDAKHFDPRIAYINGGVCNKLIRAGCIKEARFRDREIEDLFFQLEILPHIKRYAFVNETLYQYFVNDAKRRSISDGATLEKCIPPFSAIAEKFRTNDGYKSYMPILEAVGFIRLGIGKTIFSSSNDPAKTEVFVKEAKCFMDLTIPGWRKNRLLGIQSIKKGHFKAVVIWMSRVSYKLGLFAILVKLYNWYSKKRNKVVRW